MTCTVSGGALNSTQSIGEKERADLSGRIGHGHLVVICAEHRRPHPLLLVSRLLWCLAAQIGVAKSDFSEMCRSSSGLIKNAEHFARIDLDRSRFEKERSQ